MVMTRRIETDSHRLQLGRSGWAWEWLRRNPDYGTSQASCAAARRRIVRNRPLMTVIESPQRNFGKWGLCFPEDPKQPFERAAVFWSPSVDPEVCPVTAIRARAGSGPGVIDLSELRVSATVLVMPSGEQHLLLCDGARSIQFHILEGSVLNGPTRLAHVLGNFTKLNEHTRTIERLGAVLENTRFPADLFEREPNAAKWLLMLKAIDLEAGGKTHSEIADALYGDDPKLKQFSTDWRRSRVRRLLESGHALIDGGYRKILDPSRKSASQAA
jgi:hypothetical protein